ncbi:hypothetical protein V4R08_16770 (plasmid) [Nitrobacter sp. NHB1]|uniref:hypothetical protein n=1 Tax=Nitrobacter sp. NHB1 TaxID=3119830 RepID=UPI002FFE46B9
MRAARVSTSHGQYIRCYQISSTPCRQLGRRSVHALIAGIMMVDLATGADAQSLTPDPGAWRPMSYADLQKQSPQTATYQNIWKDAIEVNNRAYKARGDQRFAEGNAPATEAHFVIWSSTKSVVLSILNTVAGCTLKELRAAAGATVKLCPLRIAIYEGLQVHTLDGGRACFLELASPVAGTSVTPQAASYASYDVATKTVRTGVIIDHQAVDGCSQNIALYPP